MYVSIVSYKDPISCYNILVVQEAAICSTSIPFVLEIDNVLYNNLLCNQTGNTSNYERNQPASFC